MKSIFIYEIELNESRIYGGLNWNILNMSEKKSLEYVFSAVKTCN